MLNYMHTTITILNVEAAMNNPNSEGASFLQQWDEEMHAMKQAKEQSG